MKNRLLLIAALFPLLSFGDFKVHIKYFSDVGSTNTTYHSFNNVPDESSLYYLYFNNRFGFLKIATGVASPSLTSSTAWYYSLFNYQISTNGNNYVISPAFFPRVYDLFLIADSLVQNGYTGSGIDHFVTVGSRSGYNVYFPDIVSDVFSSTNSVFRQILLSHLSSISSGLGYIRSDLSDLSFKYSSVNPLSLVSVSNAVQSAYDLSLINYPLYERWLDDLDSSSSLSPDSQAIVYNSILRSLDSLSSVDGFIQGVNNASFRNRDDLNSALSTLGNGLASGGAHHYTTPLTNELQKLNTNWVSQTKAALSNNTQQIKQQLDSMFSNPADSSTVGGGIANISRAAGVLAGAVNNNRVMVSIENSTPVTVLLDGPINLDQSQLTQLSTPLAGLERRIDTWYQDWYSFFSPNVTGYNWIQFFDMVSSFKDVNHTDLVSLQSCVSNLLLSLRGDITNSVVLTNGYLLLSDYADYIHSGGLDTLLDVMDDDSYSDLKAEIDSLYHADISEGYGRWWRYFTGLSTVQANSIFKLSNIFQAHEKLLKDLKLDNSDLDVQDPSDSSVFRKLLYTIPSDEDTFNKLSQLTNSIDQSGMVSIQRLIPDLTNRFNVAASLYDKDFVLPSEISWELIPADPSINSPARIVTIRPSEHYRLFQLLHFGLAFSYCLVNIILFPKFLLFLVRLFDRVWNKSEKLIYNSTQS